MSSALSIAATGLQTAGRQVETAARSVVSSGLAQQGSTSGSVSNPGTAAPASLPPPPPVFDVPDLATSIVDLKQAEISYKAQIDVLNIASKLEEEAINLVA